MDNNDLNPQLKKQLESLQDIPERGLQASHSSRENYLTQVRSLKPRPAIESKPSRRAKANGRRSWVSRFAAITAVLIVALSGLGGTVYAAQAALPDDLLYSVKTLTEDIQVSLESDPQDRLDLYASFASRRLTEIQTLVEAGEPVSDKALALLEKHNQKMLVSIFGPDEKYLYNVFMNKYLTKDTYTLKNTDKTERLTGKAIIIKPGIARIGHLMAIINSSEFVLSNDTGPRHISTALGKKVVSVFGPTSINRAVYSSFLEYPVWINVGCNLSDCKVPCCQESKICMTAVTPGLVCKTINNIVLPQSI